MQNKFIKFFRKCSLCWKKSLIGSWVTEHSLSKTKKQVKKSLSISNTELKWRSHAPNRIGKTWKWCMAWKPKVYLKFFKFLCKFFSGKNPRLVEYCVGGRNGLGFQHEMVRPIRRGGRWYEVDSNLVDSTRRFDSVYVYKHANSGVVLRNFWYNTLTKK